MTSKNRIRSALLTLVALAHTNTAFAAAGGGGTLPFMSPLEKLVATFEGPGALALCVLGVIGAGAVLVFGGGELNGAVKSMAMLAMGIGVLGSATNVVQAMGVTGATLDEPAPIVAPLQSPEPPADTHEGPVLGR